MIRILSYYSYLSSPPVQRLSKSFPFIMRRFSNNEAKKYTKEQESLNNHESHFRAETNNSGLGFSRFVLSKELEKIKPSLDSRSLTNQNLESMLKSLFEENPNRTENFLTLMVLYNNNLSDIPLTTLIKVLEHYAEPYSVTQENTYYLINVGECTEELWMGIMKHVDLMNFEQLLTVFKSMNSMHSSFGKKFSASIKNPPEEILEKLLEKALAVIHESNAKSLAALIQAARELNPDSITKNMHSIQLALLKEPLNVEEVDFELLKALVINLPEGFYLKNSELVLRISKKFEEKIGNFWVGDLIEAILGIHRSGMKPSFRFGMHLGDVNHDYLKTLTTKGLLNIFETFCDSKLLTSNIAEEIFFV